MENENKTAEKTATINQDITTQKPEPTVDYKALYEKMRKDFENERTFARDLKEKYQAKLTDEEVQAELLKEKAKEQEEKEKRIQALEAEISKTKAEKVFVGAGLEETEYSKVLDKIIEASPNSASEIATEIKELIAVVTKKTEDRLNKELLNGLGNPTSGKGGNNESDFKQFQEKNPMTISKEEITF